MPECGSSGKSVGERAGKPEARSLNNLGRVLRDEGKLDGVEAIQREALALMRRSLGNEHREVAVFRSNLALTLRDQGKLAEAETMFHEAQEVAAEAG